MTADFGAVCLAEPQSDFQEAAPQGAHSERRRSCRWLDKNANRLFVTCALANLFVVRRRLLRLQGA